MRNLFTIMLLGACFASCNRKMIPTTETYLVDSVVVKTVETVRFDTVVVKGETVIITSPPAPCPPPPEGGAGKAPKQVVRQQVAVKKGVTLLTTLYNDGSFEAECKTDSLLHIIAVKDREISTLKLKDHKQVITNTVVKVKYRIPWWVYGIAVALVGYRYRHGIMSLLTNRLPWS
jgi:hypothetical protein